MVSDFLDRKELRETGELLGQIDRLIAEANNDPECFKCKNPITELNEVCIATVRIKHEPLNVWMHKGCVKG